MNKYFPILFFSGALIICSNVLCGQTNSSNGNNKNKGLTQDSIVKTNAKAKPKNNPHVAVQDTIVLKSDSTCRTCKGHKNPNK